jgi:hypothetical protein
LADYVEVLESTGTGSTVSNTTTLTTIYTYDVDGGTLSDNNRLRWQMQGNIGFASGGQLTLHLMYAGLTVASCIAANGSGGVETGIGILVEAELSGDGSVNSQFGTIHSYIGLSRADDASTPVGYGSLGAASGGNEDFEIKVQWNAASGNNTFVSEHSTLELISSSVVAEEDELDEPTAYIFISSRLNNLRYDLRKDAYFYAPLEHELEFYGYGDVTFARNSTTTATWRDGASHSIAVNEPRFEYDGDDVEGLLITTSTETLTYSTANALSNSNSLCWLQEGVYKSTVRGDTNIFNGSGVLTGLTSTHIMHIVKFNKVLSGAEDIEVETALTS